MMTRTLSITRGGPQGSILGLLLFIIYMNDIHNASSKFHAILFADDTNLTHWGQVTHICVGKLIIIGSDNGLSPDRRQAIIWINAELLSTGPLRIYFSENFIKMQQFSLKKMHMKMSSAKWRLSCLGLNVLTSTLCLFDVNIDNNCNSLQLFTNINK